MKFTICLPLRAGGMNHILRGDWVRKTNRLAVSIFPAWKCHLTRGKMVFCMPFCVSVYNCQDLGQHPATLTEQGWSIANHNGGDLFACCIHDSGRKCPLGLLGFISRTKPKIFRNFRVSSKTLMYSRTSTNARRTVQTFTLILTSHNGNGN